MTPQKQYEILRSVQLIGTLSKMIEIEFSKHLVDNKFRNPIINNHARRIKESTEQIQKMLMKPLDNEFFTYEYATNMYEIFEVLATFEADKIIEYNEGLKKMIENGN